MTGHCAVFLEVTLLSSLTTDESKASDAVNKECAPEVDREMGGGVRACVRACVRLCVCVCVCVCVESGLCDVCVLVWATWAITVYIYKTDVGAWTCCSCVLYELR